MRRPGSPEGARFGVEQSSGLIIRRPWPTVARVPAPSVRRRGGGAMLRGSTYRTSLISALRRGKRHASRRQAGRDALCRTASKHGASGGCRRCRRQRFADGPHWFFPAKSPPWQLEKPEGERFRRARGIMVAAASIGLAEPVGPVADRPGGSWTGRLADRRALLPCREHAWVRTSEDLVLGDESGEDRENTGEHIEPAGDVVTGVVLDGAPTGHRRFTGASHDGRDVRVQGFGEEFFLGREVLVQHAVGDLGLAGDARTVRSTLPCSAMRRAAVAIRCSRGF